MRKAFKRIMRRFDHLLICAHVPIIILIRLLKPAVWIRFGWLQTHKIGHLPLEAEFYLCEREADIQPARAIDFFFDRRRGDGQICNQQAMLMLTRHLRVSLWVRFLYLANRMLAGSDVHEVHIRARDEYGCRDRDGLFGRFPVQIDFTLAEREQGWQALTRIGVPRDAKFVCIHVRDAAYWRLRKPGMRNDSDYRNSDVADFIPAIEALLAQGYFVLRVGFPVSQKLAIAHERFIDYSHDHRSPFLDVFLAAHCNLMVSTGSGIDSISYMFRRPILMCNLAPVGHLYSDSASVVNMPKLHRWHGAVDWMTYREIHAAGADEFMTTDEFLEHGVEYHNASAAIICSAALEAVARVDGSWIETPEDRVLASRFWQIYAGEPRHQQVRGHISSEFLRVHKTLF